MFYYADKEGTAVSVFMRYDLSNNPYFHGQIESNKYFDLVSPYGYGGYVWEGCDPKRVAREHQEFCMSNGNLISEVVKFHPLSQFVNSYSGVISSPFHNVIRSTEGSIEDIWMNFTQKVRKNVKKANSYGLLVFHESNSDHLDDFIRVYYKTMERTNADKEYFFDKSFFEALNIDKNNIEYFYAVKGTQIISVELVLYDNVCAYSFLGGTDEEYFELRPNDLLKYEIIKWANAKQLKYFVLGGGHGDDDGIYRYKQALAPQGKVDFFVGTDLFNEEKFKYLCDIRKKEEPDFSINNRLFPAYRF